MNGAEELPTYLFEGFRLDAQRRVLSQEDGRTIPLPPKALDTLLYFVEHRGRLLDKHALLAAIWPHVVVEENNLNQTISQLRRVLGERPEEHRFIVTEPGRGYRFVASVSTRRATDETVSELESSAAAIHGARESWADSKGRSAHPYATRVWTLAVTVGLAIASLTWYLQQDRTAPLLNSIAVLPFENLSPDPDDAFFAAGLHGEILSQLAKISALNVIGQPSMLAISRPGKSLREIARELNVGTVLNATVQYARGRVRITPQLVDAATGQTLWADSYDRAFEDIFAIESDIAMEIANALEAQFSVAEQAAIERPPTQSSAAYAAYLRAQNVQNVSEVLALEYLEEATRLDPSFALAHATKAQLYAGAFIAQSGGEAANPSEWSELEARVRAAADRALELDGDSWLAHVALGNMHERLWRWTEAQRQYRLAARTLPRGVRRPDLDAWFGDLDFTELTRAQRETVALDPLVAVEHWVLGLYYAYAGNAAAAAAAFREAVTLSPNTPATHVWLAHAEGMLGNREEALRDLRRTEQLPTAHQTSIGLANLAYAYAQNGQRGDALRLVNLLAEKAPDRRHQAGNWALAYLAVDDVDAARESLEVVIGKIANQEPDPGYLTLRLIRANIYSDPVLDEPSFVALREQLRGR
jgi:TolB-like protein/DNA-binding winged helix-turn-helix (wHTH) protein